MIKITDKTRCSGCGACASKCPKKCIQMTLDSEGFLYPRVDTASCIDCGLCEKVCPILNPYSNKKIESIGCFAAYSNNQEIRKESSSGGIFSEMANNVFDNNGVVFGAAFDDDWSVKHTYIETADEIKRLRGSKYVQSDIKDSYINAKKFLDEGRQVLFSGTPCQIGGLYSFLNKEYDNLITVDFICHGVPSRIVWDEYLKIQKGTANADIIDISFRNKDNGWAKFNTKISFENGEEYVKYHSEDMFMKTYLSDISLRPACYYCSFKGKNRKSDITLADYWGVNRAHPEINDDKGISLIFINSKCGQLLIDKIKGNLFMKNVDENEVVKYNKSINLSSPVHPNRRFFMKRFQKHKFNILQKSLKITLFNRLTRKVKLKLKIRKY